MQSSRLRQKKKQRNEDSIVNILEWNQKTTQLAFTCSKSTIETLQKGVKFVQS